MKPQNKPAVIALNIQSQTALRHHWLAESPNGGLFLPTDRQYEVGDDIFMLITLSMNDGDGMDRFPVTGKVAWVNPANATDNQYPQGVAIHFIGGNVDGSNDLCRTVARLGMPIRRRRGGGR